MILNNAKTAILFKGGSYSTNVQGHVISFPDVSITSALISISQAKQIVKTQIQGRDGTVKEYIGLDDYMVTVSGVLTSSPGVAPTDAVLNLKKMLNAPIAIDVVCTFLNQLDIHQLVVDHYELPQNEGGISYQTFTMNFISEIPTQLRIISV